MSDAMLQDVDKPDLTGEHYTESLHRLHAALAPKTYFEIGTETGQSLAYASCPSLAVDPSFRIEAARMAQILKREATFFFGLKSDDFFSKYDPTRYLGGKIELAFLDGLHWCEFLLRDFINTEKHCGTESVIILHDCLPVEPVMADRIHGARSTIRPHRQGKWAGDVWKTAVALKRHRPDLHITAIDSAPTGLLIVSGLDPTSDLLSSKYDRILEDMAAWDLDHLGIDWLFCELDVQRCNVIDSDAKIRATLAGGRRPSVPA